MKQRGFTLVEALVAVTIGALVVSAMLPALADSLRRARFDTAVRTVVTDVREARSLAITTGWEYRLIGRRDARQYRMMARASSAVGWPAIGAAPFRDSTRYAGPWFDFGDEFDGVTINSAAWRYIVTFDPRGAASQNGFSPLEISNGDDRTASITVSAVGGITVQ